MSILRKIAYAGWKNCIQISNTVFDAVLTTDVGPRIIRYGEAGGPNLLYVDEYTCGSTEETKTWRAYGGHSFDLLLDGEPFFPPENQPVGYELKEDSILFSPIVQDNLQKDISVRMCRRGGLEIKQKITCLTGSVTIRICGRTRFCPDGTAALPFPQNDRLSETPCGKEITLIRSGDGSRNRSGLFAKPEKVWCASFLRGSLLIMTAPPVPDTEIAWEDSPCFSEMRLYSPETILRKGESLEQTEVWNIFPDLPMPVDETQAEQMMKNNRYFYDFVKKPVKGLDY